MTTVQEQWAETDRKLNERFKFETQRAELGEWSAMGRSDSHYRSKLREVEKAEELLAGLRQHQAALQAKVDEAVARHAEITAPLQEQLAGNLPIAERIKLRAEVNKANSDLEAAVAPLREQLAAVESEIEFTRPRAGQRQQIINAFVNSGSQENRERLRILREAGDVLEKTVLFGWKRKAAAAEAAFEDAKAKNKYCDLDLLGETARIQTGIYEVLRQSGANIGAEVNAIRESRLQELLYSE